jgi:hypothetical protein
MKSFLFFSRWKELAKKGKIDKIPLKTEEDSAEEIAEKVKKATERKEKAKTNEEKLAAAAALEEAKALLKQVRRPSPLPLPPPHLSQSLAGATKAPAGQAQVQVEAQRRGHRIAHPEVDRGHP